MKQKRKSLACSARHSPPWDSDGRTILTPKGHARALSRCISRCYWVDAFHHLAKLVDYVNSEMTQNNSSSLGA